LYNVTAIAFNTTGSQSLLSDEYAISVDTTAPTTGSASLTTMVAGGTYMMPNITGSCGTETDNGSVNIITTNPANGFTTYPATATLDENGDFDFDVTWIDGTYDIVIGCTDVAGNGPAITAISNVTIDNGNPAAPTITSPSPGSLGGVLNTTPTIEGTCEAGATVAIASADITPNPTTGLCAAGGTYSIPIAMNTNDLTLSITQIDAGSNISDTTTVTIGVDTDGDGVPNSIEDAGFNGGDANGDGIPDSTQQNVSGAFNPVTGENATLVSTGDCTFIVEHQFLAESSLTTDTTADYPVGLVDFKVQCPAGAPTGESADITIYYGQQYNTSNWQYKKYDTDGNVYSTITDLASFADFTFATGPASGSTVTAVSFTVTDGDLRTDEDGIENDEINDQIQLLRLLVSLVPMFCVQLIVLQQVMVY